VPGGSGGGTRAVGLRLRSIVGAGQRAGGGEGRGAFGGPTQAGEGTRLTAGSPLRPTRNQIHRRAPVLERGDSERVVG
jgi:hypothetical protein